MIEETNGYVSGQQFAQEVISTLVAQDIDLDEPQSFALYLYVPSEAVAIECQNKIQANGYQCDIEESASDDADWLCYITTGLMVPEDAALTFVGTLLIELAHDVNGEFDGWEIEQGFSFSFEPELDYAAVAQNIFETLQSNFKASHDYAVVNLSDFDGLDIEFYDEVQQGFSALGYITLSEIEDRTISATGCKTVIRTMYHPELKGVAIAYFVPEMGAGVYEIETFLANGKVLVSTIMSQSYEITKWPLLEYRHYSSDLGISELHSEHQKQLLHLQNEADGIELKSVTSFAELVDVQNQMSLHKNSHLNEIGWITKEYLLVQTNGDEVIAEGVYEAFQELVQIQMKSTI